MNAMTAVPAAGSRACTEDTAENGMEVIGRLSGGIAHDFNNLLTGILLYCDLLLAGLENLGSNEEVQALARDGIQNQTSSSFQQNNGLYRQELRRHVEEIRLASEQGAALTQQLLLIARKHVVRPSPVEINAIVRSTENLLRRLIGEQIELVVELDPALDRRTDLTAGLVLADPAQLRQVLLNLVLNARDAIPHGGKIHVTTRATEFSDSTYGSDAAPGAARRAVSLTVQDNGCGMDATTRARMFEPFFTTKKEGVGTGLGMATVQRIVTEAGGEIWIESEPSHGTSICVLLPLIEAFP